MAQAPVLLSWSGGKDSAWALHVLRHNGCAPVALLSTVTEDYGRASMQGVHRSVLQAQARAAGLPLLEARIPAGCDDATYQAAFALALDQARHRWPDLHRVAFGDLLLADIRDWRTASCQQLGWQAVFPLFGSDTAALARRMIEAGLRAHLCCVDTQQLDGSFAGHAFDRALLSCLPAHIDPCGEHGEFHTCVSDGPMFSHPLPVVRGDHVLRDERFLYTDFRLQADP